jgi:hypothetical protein
MVPMTVLSMLTPTICASNRQAKSGGIDCLAIIRRESRRASCPSVSYLFALDAVTSCEIYFLIQVDADHGQVPHAKSGTHG